ncbi:hypothetical protein [Modestobacter sp. NPDC049651]|uniref:hypothetical protein n=1 Tax=unclassified Modestobacter TaxID=2643866 RepID=UPI00340535B9
MDVHRSPAPGSAAGVRQALADAAEAAARAPSVQDTRPWTLVVHPDRLELLADRSRQLPATDPEGRELLVSLGAALLNVRAFLAAAGCAVEVDRFPDRGDPDLVAVVRPVRGDPDPDLARLADAVPRRHSERRPYRAERLPADLLAQLTAAAAAEDTQLRAVVSDAVLRLLGRLTHQADAVLTPDPYRADRPRRWTPDPFRPGRSGVPASTGETFLLLTSRRDDPVAWVRAGEALERLLLLLTVRGWAASPVTQVMEVPATRDHLRAALTADAHPQTMLRVGHVHEPGRAPAPQPPRDVRHGPLPDGRGGTRWT